MAIEGDKVTELARNIAPNTVSSEHLFRTLSQNHPQDHQNHPQDHQNRIQDHQNHLYKQPPLGAPYKYGSAGSGDDSGGPGGSSGGPGGGSETVFKTDVRNRQCSEQRSEPTQ